ncbi:site-specific integrase [Yinghuangia sp. ASG 101]|uniref:site-specific integrase n=1 Tax=Yinghuangia sp. ASG 101 TaxID=2896848 RepID=UPI001E52D904|nr:site-specific integrase [Yinghuangia sp. ASG 101]UGQ14848.1 site-specific integrase [Yinghuangia sp. ASG 101]
MKGSTYRRCYCRDADGKPLGAKCPKLSNRKHGSYSVRQELPNRPDGTRRAFNRAGYATATAAQADLDRVRSLLALADADDEAVRTQLADLLEQISRNKSPLPDVEATRRSLGSGRSLTARLTVGEVLDDWLAGKRGRRSAIARDEGNIRIHLKPHIGDMRVDRLRVADLTAMFNAIADANVETAEANAARRAVIAELAEIPWKGRENRARRKALKATIAEMPPFRRMVGPATRQRIRSTLRAALNDAIAQQIITFNPAAHVSLDAARRPKPVIWTQEHIAYWQRTGEPPSPVMVWTPEQTGRFLDRVQDDRLYALWYLIAFRGLRRGEACGTRWIDVDLTSLQLTVAKQLVVDGWEVYEDQPKTDAGARTIALDVATGSVLRAHRTQQDRERREWGDAWTDTGRAFTREDGSWLNPKALTGRFRDLCARAALPPIRLHDLRHGAATIAHAAGADLKTIQEMLGHSSIAITANTYTSVLPTVGREAAEGAARIVPRSRRADGAPWSPLMTGDDLPSAQALLMLTGPTPPPGHVPKRL